MMKGMKTMKIERAIIRLTSTLTIFSILVLFTWAFAQQPATGQKTYGSKCAMCHGKDGKAETKAGKSTQTPDLTKGPWKHGSSPAEVEKIIREGFKKMPKYEGKLSPDEIKAVAEYTRKLAGVEK